MRCPVSIWLGSVIRGLSARICSRSLLSNRPKCSTQIPYNVFCGSTTTITAGFPVRAAAPKTRSTRELLAAGGVVETARGSVGRLSPIDLATGIAPEAPTLSNWVPRDFQRDGNKTRHASTEAANAAMRKGRCPRPLCTVKRGELRGSRGGGGGRADCGDPSLRSE